MGDFEYVEGDATLIAAHVLEIEPQGALAQALDLTRIGPYRSYLEVMQALHARAQSAGARVVKLALSVDGRPLFGIEFGPERHPRLSLVLAGLHAMEWVGVEVALKVVELLAERTLAQRVLVVPVMNPDGYLDVEGDLRAGIMRFRRGNRRNVDLNRNWPEFFRKKTNWFQRRFPALGTSGEGALSEPEVQGIVRYVEDQTSYDARVSTVVSLHSFGRKILYPYGALWRAPKAAARLRGYAKWLRDTIGGKRRYGCRQVSHWWPGFSFAHGMELDYFYERHGASAFIIECSRGGFQLFDRSSWRHPFRWFNPRRLSDTVDTVAPAVAALVEQAGATASNWRGEAA